MRGRAESCTPLVILDVCERESEEKTEEPRTELTDRPGWLAALCLGGEVIDQDGTERERGERGR